MVTVPRVRLAAAVLAMLVPAVMIGANGDRDSDDITLLFTAQSTARTTAGAPVTTQVDNLRLDTTVKWLGPSPAGSLVVYNGNGSVSGWGILLLGSADNPPNTLAILAGGIVVATSPMTLTAGKWQHLRAERVSQNVTLTLSNEDGHGAPPQITAFGVIPVNPVGAGFASSEQTIIGDRFNGFIESASIRNLDPAKTLIESWTFDHGTASGKYVLFGNPIGTKGNVLNLTSTAWAFPKGHDRDGDHDDRDDRH